MDKFRANTNGERDGWAAAVAEEAENSYRRVTSQSQSSHFQPESHRVDEPGFRFPRPSVDLRTLESSFRKLSFADSSVVQNGNPTLQDRYNWVSNGGGGYSLPHRDLESQQMNQFQNGVVNGSYGHDAGQAATTSVLRNNGLLNGNFGDVPYSSRNRYLDQSPCDYPNGFGSGIINSGSTNYGFGYNHYPSPSLENERGSVLSLARDRVFSMELQKMIGEGSKETFDKIFNELIVHICDLMVDPFGHDVVQTLMGICSSEQITQIVDMVTNPQFRFAKICCDSLGTSSIQWLLRCIRHRSEDQIVRIMETISMVALKLARSNHAQHVILECFRLFSLSQYSMLLEVIAQNCYCLAIDQYGCCLLQHSLHNNCVELKQRLIFEIIANAFKLCLNSYGNYVVQYVVELDNRNDTSRLVTHMAGNYGYLSRNKYGSHVVQKLLKIKYINSRLITDDLIREIDTLLLDPYGNYVIQTAWFVSEGNVRLILRWHIERNIGLMRCSKFGRKILEKLNL